MSDEDLFGPAPPHPIEHATHKKPSPALTYADIDPRASAANREIVKRMQKSRFWMDVCTCSVGDQDRVITDDRNPKCCKRCPWCSMRIKVGFFKDHTAYCSAADRSSVPLPWWRRPPGVSSGQPAEGVANAKPIEEAGTVHESGGARVQTGSSGRTAGKRREGVRRGGQRARNKKPA